MATQRTIHRLVSLAALLRVADCATTRRYPATETRPVRLVSWTPFKVHGRASVWSDRQPQGACDCLQGRPGFVVRSSAPDLQGETTVVPAEQKRLFVGYVLITALVTLVALAGV